MNARGAGRTRPPIDGLRCFYSRLRNGSALNPTYGISIFTHPYYLHILYSTYRATAAFLLAVLLSGPLGICMGWSNSFHRYASSLFGLLRRVPPLAWVPRRAEISLLSMVNT